MSNLLSNAAMRRARKLRSRGVEAAVNVLGPRMWPPVLVLESDDWGATRLVDGSTRGALEAAGIDMSSCAYDRVDCLESRADLERLVDVLTSVRDATGAPAVMTTNMVMTNPDFDAIAASAFETYVPETLWNSYARYHAEQLQPVWEQARSTGAVVPQFHSREHLHTGLWLSDLRAGHTQTRAAFDHRYYAHTTTTGDQARRHYLAACWAASSDDLARIGESLVDGLRRFQAAFGMRSQTFVPCNFVFPEALERLLADQGVTHIQSQRAHLNPQGQPGRPPVKRRYTGQRSAAGPTFGVRNVLFEPFEDEARDWVDEAMASIALAFRMQRPAIVCTHRASYVGSIAEANRDRGLRSLRALLDAVKRRWPEVRFSGTPAFAQRLERTPQRWQRMLTSLAEVRGS